ANTVNLVKGAFSNYEITISGATTNTNITFYGNKGINGNNVNSRFFIDDILVVANSTTSSPIDGSPYAIAEPAASYTVSGLNPGSIYTYTVKAVKGTVTSAASNIVT